MVFSSYGVRESSEVNESEGRKIGEIQMLTLIESRYSAMKLTSQTPNKDPLCLTDEVIAQTLIVRIVSKMLIIFNLE